MEQDRGCRQAGAAEGPDEGPQLQGEPPCTHQATLPHSGYDTNTSDIIPGLFMTSPFLLTQTCQGDLSRITGRLLQNYLQYMAQNIII